MQGRSKAISDHIPKVGNSDPFHGSGLEEDAFDPPFRRRVLAILGHRHGEVTAP
jgi:hypothetical protein